jgi:hypothetical protein
VGEAFRNEKLFAIFKTKLFADPLAVGWRAFADINGDIKEQATPAADKFGLCIGRA